VHTLAPGDTLWFDGSGIALYGTLGERCCEPGHAQVFVDGRPTADETGIWQDKSSLGATIPGTVLFAWSGPRSGHHTLLLVPRRAVRRRALSRPKAGNTHAGSTSRGGDMKTRGTTFLLALAVAMTLAGGTAQARAPQLHFSVFANTGHNMADILWTGNQFLYVENTANVIWSAPVAGMPLAQFASMPKLVEETRCVLSPGTHGYAAGDIYCASPDDKIYDISGDGSSVRVLATLPVRYPPASDGALAFDDVGRFGFQLVAATGRSGANQPAGGRVFTISPTGAVGLVGKYPGPGGADEVLIAPKGFGTAGGDALLTVDAGAAAGAVVAMDPRGRVRTLASLSSGPNPLAIVPQPSTSSGGPEAGWYVTDDITQNVFFAPATQFSSYVGDLVVGSEVKGRFWVLRPHGRSYTSIELRSNLGGRDSLEGAVFVP
jgi:hypothetical protein